MGRGVGSEWVLWWYLRFRPDTLFRLSVVEVLSRIRRLVCLPCALCERKFPSRLQVVRLLPDGLLGESVVEVGASVGRSMLRPHCVLPLRQLAAAADATRGGAYRV